MTLCVNWSGVLSLPDSAPLAAVADLSLPLSGSGSPEAVTSSKSGLCEAAPACEEDMCEEPLRCPLAELESTLADDFEGAA